MNLVVFKTNFLGDNVTFVPVVQAIRRAFPAANLSLVTQPGVEDLYTGDIAPEDMLLVPQAAMLAALRRPWRAWPWYQWLQHRRPDGILLSYDQSTIAHLISWASGARVRLGARFRMPLRRSGLTHGVEWNPAWSIAQWHWEMAREFVRLFGGEPLPPTPPPPNLSHLTSGVTPQRGRVLIHPGSKREMTRWPVQRYADLAGRLAARGFDVLWSRVRDVDTALPPGVTPVETPRLPDFVRTLASASLFVGNDSGPMHVANALGVPSIVVFGPTPVAWEPAWHRDRLQVLRRPELACQPCDRPDLLPHACFNSAEPLACLRRWEVTELERRCVEQLQRSP